jgi:hypothetical protein
MGPLDTTIAAPLFAIWARDGDTPTRWSSIFASLKEAPAAARNARISEDAKWLIMPSHTTFILFFNCCPSQRHLTGTKAKSSHSGIHLFMDLEGSQRRACVENSFQ